MLHSQLKKVEKIASGSKLARFAARPYRYVKAIAFRKLFYPFQKKGLPVQAPTFWEEPFVVELPAGTDIYLTGGKTDESEIRLARYLIQTLKPGDTFVDIGSHFGYFSRLAIRILNGQGKVIAVEPSKKTFLLLQQNLTAYPEATALNCLIGAENTTKEFFEFPVSYSEYNTAFPEQFQEKDWFQKAEVTHYSITSKTLDSLIAEFNVIPKLIKIDTEGSEAEVIKGASQMLATNREVALVMEYLSKTRHNEAHVQAAALLNSYGFYPFVINPDGTLISCNNVDQHLTRTNRDSDNIVFKHSS